MNLDFGIVYDLFRNRRTLTPRYLIPIYEHAGNFGARSTVSRFPRSGQKKSHSERDRGCVRGKICILRMNSIGEAELWFRVQQQGPSFFIFVNVPQANTKAPRGFLCLSSFSATLKRRLLYVYTSVRLLNPAHLFVPLCGISARH